MIGGRGQSDVRITELETEFPKTQNVIYIYIYIYIHIYIYI